MKPCILRKVPYRLPGSRRLVWGFVLAQREGLSLLFVQKPDECLSHSIIIGAENVAERVFESVNVSRFPLEHEDLADIGNKMQALGDGLSEEEFRKFFQIDDD